MSIQTGKIAAKQLLNTQVGREITGSISNMIHRGIDKTSGTLQRGIENVSQNVKDRTSADNMTNSFNKMGGKGKRRKHSGGFNIIENEDGSRMNIIEDDEPQVNVIENDYENGMNIIEDNEPQVNVIENDYENENIIEDDEPHVNVIEDDHTNVIENEVTGGKAKKNSRKTKKSKKMKKTKKTMTTKKSKKTRTTKKSKKTN